MGSADISRIGGLKNKPEERKQVLQVGLDNKSEVRRCVSLMEQGCMD